MIRSPRSGSLRIHVHVASAGELEQALGIRTAVDRLRDDISWSISFSSPSGRRHLESRPETFDTVTYLPLDRVSEIGRFLDLVQPDAILFVRYDLWPVFVEESRRRGIPMMLACATIGEGRLHAPLIRTLTRGTLTSLARISAVSDEQAERLRRAAPGVPVQVDGDARLDRVLNRHSSGITDPVRTVKDWIGPRRAVILGSTWPPDEELWLAAGFPDGLPEGTAIVIVPHRIDPEHIDRILASFPDAALLSRLVEPGGNERSDSPVLVVDALGILADLYQLGDLAWVGGGFGEGVHSVAEPAAVGIPILSGPGVERSPDAVALASRGGLRIVHTPEELTGAIHALLSGGASRVDAVEGVSSWVAMHRGGASRIADALLMMVDRHAAPNGAVAEFKQMEGGMQ